MKLLRYINKENYFKKTLFFLATLFSSLIYANAFAFELAFLTCEDDPIEAEEIPLNWNVDDQDGNGVAWGNIAACGESSNYTGGSGNAFCAASELGSLNYDTTLETNDFTLVGATSAVLRFKLNYQDVAPGNDRFDVEVSTNSGGSWTTVNTWDFDVGGFQVVGSGVEVAVPLNVYLGESDVEVRFRYFDTGAPPDNGFYVQIDDIYLDCLGGADMQSTVSSNKTTVIEGEELAYTTEFLNNGPATANDVVGITTIPPGLTVLDTTFTQGVLMPSFSGSTGGDIGTLMSGNASNLVVTARAQIYPEVELEVMSPFMVAGTYEAFGATFGPEISPASPISGLLIIPDDPDGTSADACTPILNGSEINGNIAIMPATGNCSKDEQVKNVQDAGAIAAILINEGFIFFPYEFAGSPLIDVLSGNQVMQPSGNVTDPITIPSILISYEDGNPIRDNVVNSVMAKISGKEILSQDNTILSMVFANEMDSWLFWRIRRYLFRRCIRQ